MAISGQDNQGLGSIAGDSGMNSSLELMNLKREQDTESMVERIRSDERDKIADAQLAQERQQAELFNGLEMARKIGQQEGPDSQERMYPQPSRIDYSQSGGGLGSL